MPTEIQKNNPPYRSYRVFYNLLAVVFCILIAGIYLEFSFLLDKEKEELSQKQEKISEILNRNAGLRNIFDTHHIKQLTVTPYDSSIIDAQSNLGHFCEKTLKGQLFTIKNNNNTLEFFGREPSYTLNNKSYYIATIINLIQSCFSTEQQISAIEEQNKNSWHEEVLIPPLSNNTPKGELIPLTMQQ